MKTNYKLVVEKQKKGVRLYAVLCLVFFVLIGAYCYFKWIDYDLNKRAITANETNIDTLKKTLLSEKDEYSDVKMNFDDLTKDVESSLGEIFPADDAYTELNRSFDAFAEQIHRSKNPFVISSIEYEDEKTADDGSAKYLPLRMTISSSRENFTKFLQYVEKSGSLLNKVRLMDIQSIHLSFGEDDEEESINFSIKIHAYFQNI